MNNKLKNCPFCNKEVDPLRAAAVSIVDGKITHFCSTSCRETYLQRQPESDLLVDKESATGLDATPDGVASGGNDASSKKVIPGSKERGSKQTDIKLKDPPSNLSLSPALASAKAPLAKLLWPFAIEIIVLVILVVLLFIVRPHHLSGHLHLAIVGFGIFCSLVWGVFRERKNGVSVLINTAAIPLASTGVCVSSFFMPSLDWPMAVALALPIIRSIGRCAELLSRNRSGVLDVVSGLHKDLVPREWRDNSLLALRIRKIAMVIDWARIPLAVFGGIGLWLGEIGSLGSVVMSSVIGLIVLDPRLLRMVTGDAQLKVALYAGRMGASIRDASAVAQVAKSKMLFLMAKESLVLPKVKIADFYIRDVANIDHVFSALASLESAFTDRFAVAIVKYCKAQSVRNVDKVEASKVDGKGVFGDTTHGTVHCGSRMFMLENGISTGEEEVRAHDLEQSGRRVFFFALDGELVALFGIDEEVRPGAKNAVQKLSMMGFSPVMLTSAEVDSALALGERIGVENVKFQCRDGELEEAIGAVHKAGYDVTLVGNGIAFEQSVRTADCTIAVGGRSRAGSLAGIDARGLELGGVAQLLEYAVSARKSVVRNLLVTLLLYCLGICFALGWNSTFMALGMSGAVAIVSFMSTLSGPYPFFKEGVEWCMRMGNSVLQMLGVSQRNNSYTSKK